MDFERRFWATFGEIINQSNQEKRDGLKIRSED